MAAEETDNVLNKKKTHRERKAGRKADKKKAKKVHIEELTDKQRNPKAFALRSAVSAERRFRRKQDIETKKQHIPIIDRTPLEPPPLVVAVVGPAKVGKTTLIQNLIKNFAKQPLKHVKGPVTLVTGKKRRITIVECNNDINSMIDLAKVADLVLLLIDASFGFEMEVFEFLNICQVHGMPRILGVLTHLDHFKQSKQLKKVKKTLKHRFWTEVYPGAKLFYLSGMIHGQYLKNDIRNLGRFISCIKLRPITWRTTHPYMLVDRLEDITDPETKRQNPKCDRDVCLYGYMRGIPLNKENGIHIPGCGDSKISSISFLPDPCPLPEKKNRSLIERERLIYAPFSGVGGIVYDKDAVYIELAGSHSHNEDQGEATEYFQSMLSAQDGMDVKRDRSELKIFSSSIPIISQEFEDTNAFTSGKVLQDEKEILEGKIENENENDRNKILMDDIEGDDSVEEDGEVESNSNLKKFFEEKIETDGRIRRKVIFKDELDDDSTTDKESDSSDDDDSLKNENLEFRGLNKKKDIDIKSKITEVLNKLELKDSKPKNESKIDSSSEESGIEMELEDIKKQEKRKLSFSDREQDNKKVKKKREDSTDEEESDEDDYEMIDEMKEKKNSSSFKLEEDSEDEEEEGDNDADADNDSEDDDENDDKDGDYNDYDTSAVKWKENLTRKAADAFSERQNTTQNLYKLVYGDYKKNLDKTKFEDDVEEEEVGGIFRLVSEKQRIKLQEKDELDERDCSLFPVQVVRDWAQPEISFLIKDCFVTGKWKKSEDAEELLKLDALSDEDEYGDFEDLESGQKHTAEKSKDEKPPKEDNREDKAALLERKMKLKEQFDAEYDEKDESTYYNELKAATEQQAQLNKEEFENLPDELRVELEGYRAGMYVRIEISSMPCELVEYFDPTFPLIVGGLLPNEENIGYLQGRLKKHRWYSKILKSKDPLIISLGWRRFQTLPIFTKLEDNFRQRMLKYTPQHVSCMGHMYGPITPQGTGFLAVQNVAVRPAGFRIACTGSIVEVDKSTTITKKLKLIGTPQKIYQKTAFIQGMFNSALEVGKFEGAKIKTVSGIRGQIKKALSKPPGAFRATFEDKIKKSDIVFCRTWYPIEVPKFYNPVSSLLLAPEQKTAWEGMKTLGQLKRERNVKNEAEADSMYTPIHRKPKKFKPIVIPKHLQKSLPYKDKPKEVAKTRDPNKGRVVVVREPREQETAHLLKMIAKNYEQKKEVEKLAMRDRVKKHKKMIREQELKKLKKQKELKKQICRTLSKMEKAKKKPK